MISRLRSTVSRREFARLGGVGLATLGAGSKLFAWKPIPIALELYSIREDCKQDVPGSLAQVAKMGYEGVEFAGYYDYSAKDLRKLLDDNGLKCCSVHIGMSALLGDELPRTVEFNQILGNTRLTVASLPRVKTAKPWYDAARQFNEIAEKLKPHGMRAGFHNHPHEFESVEGEIPWEIVFDNTVEDVIMQLDTGSVVRAGADPAVYLKRYPGRSVTMHLKDYSPTNEKALLGEGVVNFKEVFELAETIGGIQWYIVEQESYPYPPMECVKRCLENLRKLRA
jgi:sugar phosphate isomerase/epimerase